MNHRLDVRVPVDSPRVARAVTEALAVETRSAPPRTRVEVRADDSDVLLCIEADDARVLRAAANSFLRLVHSAAAVGRAAVEARGPAVRAS